MQRREFLTAAAATGGALWLGTSALAQVAAQPAPVTEAEAPAVAAISRPFGFEDVVAIAEATSAKAYVDPKVDLVGSFADLSYDQFRGIRFRRDHDPWAEHGRFGLDLLPPGMLYRDRVEINLVTPEGEVRPMPFDPRAFDFQPDLFPNPIDMDNIGKMSWSGFRLRATLNRPDVLDEFAVFQGASYFRAVARGTSYGLSARGLALNTGLPEGEEFPLFRAFWLHTPGAADGALTIHALLDSPSVAGAYQFVLHPGADTVITTRVALFPRKPLAAAGIAPLTSMFWFSDASREGIDDYRRAVHDSDGLQMITGAGRRLWRVLQGPPTLQLSAFQDENPEGFGLSQRPRSFEDYQDAEARYETRPSAWIQPHASWGKGAVGLVEIPVDNEFHDNIVSFWRPGQPLAQGQRHDFGYDLIFSPLPPDRTPLARVSATRSGKSVNNPNARTYFLDFDLAPFMGVEPRITVTASVGEIGHNYVQRLPDEDRLRLAFDFLPGDAPLADLSASLSAPDGTVLTETWVARWVKG